jgi:hypothetical protein
MSLLTNVGWFSISRSVWFGIFYSVYEVGVRFTGVLVC